MSVPAANRTEALIVFKYAGLQWRTKVWVQFNFHLHLSGSSSLQSNLTYWTFDEEVIERKKKKTNFRNSLTKLMKIRYEALNNTLDC